MRIALLALAAMLWIACGQGSEPAAPKPEAPPAPAPPKAPEKPAEPPPAPAEPAAADPERGGELYASYCASCHGARGNADGPLAQSLDPTPAKHSDAAYMETLSDDHLFKVIKEGGAAVGKSPLMAPWGGTLTDAQIYDVIAFIKTLY